MLTLIQLVYLDYSSYFTFGNLKTVDEDFRMVVKNFSSLLMQRTVAYKIVNPESLQEIQKFILKVRQKVSQKNKESAQKTRNKNGKVRSIRNSRILLHINCKDILIEDEGFVLPNLNQTPHNGEEEEGENKVITFFSIIEAIKLPALVVFDGKNTGKLLKNFSVEEFQKWLAYVEKLRRYVESLQNESSTDQDSTQWLEKPTFEAGSCSKEEFITEFPEIPFICFSSGGENFKKIHDDLPDDYFTQILTNPVAAILSFIYVQNKSNYPNLMIEFFSNFSTKLLNDLKSLFNQYFEVAWKKLLSQEIFELVLKKDKVVSQYVRNFVLAVFIYGRYQIIPQIYPKLVPDDYRIKRVICQTGLIRDLMLIMEHFCFLMDQCIKKEEFLNLKHTEREEFIDSLNLLDKLHSTH
eukprot:snap_masked-scaffold_8-processed-gene-5.36-mRNA-1 protein AED:1.00 eAED:1.00 QI:0/-1/0/0/-1/1/1/0/408